MTIIAWPRKPDPLGDDLAAAIANVDAGQIVRSLYDAAATSADKLVETADSDIRELETIIADATEKLRLARIVRASFATAREALVDGVIDGAVPDPAPAKAKGKKSINAMIAAE
jgi:hypothetical protein